MHRDPAEAVWPGISVMSMSRRRVQVHLHRDAVNPALKSDANSKNCHNQTTGLLLCCGICYSERMHGPRWGEKGEPSSGSFIFLISPLQAPIAGVSSVACNRLNPSAPPPRIRTMTQNTCPDVERRIRFRIPRTRFTSHKPRASKPRSQQSQDSKTSDNPLLLCRHKVCNERLSDCQ